MLAPSALAADRPAVRVDQLGYAPREAKVAYLIAPRARPRARFAVIRRGKVVVRGRARHNRGHWNRRFRAVQTLDFSRLRTPGRYRIRVAGVVSPRFRVAAGIFRPHVADTVTFFQAQRDGADVIRGELRRRPAHLNDRSADVYAHPRYDSRTAT